MWTSGTAAAELGARNDRRQQRTMREADAEWLQRKEKVLGRPFRSWRRLFVSWKAAKALEESFKYYREAGGLGLEIL